MESYVHSSELNLLGKQILKSYITSTNEKSVSIFLCGGVMSGGTSRQRFYNQCKSERNLIIRFPEGLFDELLEKNAYNLLELEEILADSVDAIVIFPESPGSWAELGAFSENPALRKKIICISEKKYSRAFSFINLGPIKILKKEKPSKVIDFPYKNIGQNRETKELLRSVIKHARIIKSEYPSKKIGIFKIEEFLIYSLFCLDTATWLDLKSIFTHDEIGLTKEKKDKFLDICINTLLTTRKIEINEDGKFMLSEKSTRFILESIPKSQLRYLQGIRIEIMNSYLRRQAKFNHDMIEPLPL